MKIFRMQSVFAHGLAVIICLFGLQGLWTASAFSQEQVDTVSSQTDSSAPVENQTTGTGQPGSEENPVFGMPRYFPPPFPEAGKDRVRIGGGQQVGPEETVNDMVTIFGPAEMAGKVTGDMVTVFGDSRMTGSLRGDMVTIFGNAEIDGPVSGETVVIFGSLKLGPHAILNGDCVSIFGKLDRDAAAVLYHESVEILPQLASLKSYFIKGPLMGRLLPPGSALAWIVVALHFILYFLVAVIIPKPTASAVRQLEQNLFLSFGIGLLALILLAPLSFILLATGIGIILMPLIGIAELALGVLGKTSVLEFFGIQTLRGFGLKGEQRPIAGFLIGFALVTVLYMIPVLGLLIWLILRPLALGAAVLAVFRSMKKNGNGHSAPGIPVNPAPPQTAAHENTGTVPPAAQPPFQGNDTSMAPPPPIPEQQSPGFELSASPGVQQPIVMPRAGFWIRLGATVLDAVLLGWLIAFSGMFFICLWFAYHVAMWAWKGTTIGGIICRLKVVRLSGSSLDFAVSLVRSMASFFSAVALGLGFFWAGWSRDRQSWHDIIAGTVIVRVPQSIQII